MSSEWHQPERALSELVRPREKIVETTRRSGSTIDSQLRRKVGNLVVRAPAPDWTDLAYGSKRLFRTYGATGSHRLDRLVPEGETLPRPILLWTRRTSAKTVFAMPMILTAHRYEPLGAIPPAEVLEEGFSGLPAFKLYWKRRHANLGWRPWDMVNVFSVRSWHSAEDDAMVASWLIEKLYGEWRK